MKQHIIPSIVASIVASGAAIGFVHLKHAPEIRVVSAPAGNISPLKAAHIAKTVWPEMAQTDIDALTSSVKASPGEVTIFCVEDAKCGDLALNLDNAFESAHWKSRVIDYPMVQPGIASSNGSIVKLLRDAGLDARLDEGVHVISGDAIAIGPRPQ